MICSGYKSIVCLFCLNVVLRLVSWAETDGTNLVMSVVQTNRVATWEGEFVPSEIALFHASHSERLYAEIYRSTHQTCEGTLSDVYSLSSNVVRKVLAANVNVKGVSPVLLSIGHSTNNAFCTYWFMWRHPGNGGLQRFEEYAYTNGVFNLVRELEYGDFGEGKQWYLVDGENYSPTTNFYLRTEGVLWKNERTRYRQ